jgi:hypothetical protein
MPQLIDQMIIKRDNIKGRRNLKHPANQGPRLFLPPTPSPKPLLESTPQSKGLVRREIGALAFSIMTLNLTAKLRK